MQTIVKERPVKFSSNEIKMVKGSIDYVGINQYTSYYIYNPQKFGQFAVHTLISPLTKVIKLCFEFSSFITLYDLSISIIGVCPSRRPKMISLKGRQIS
jgi:hypothetical protein